MKLDNSKKIEILLFRIIFLICWIIVPITTYLWKNQNVATQSSVFMGWLMSSLFLLCFIFSFISKKIKGNLIYSMYFLLFVSTFSAIYYSYINQFNLEYTVLLILTLVATSVIFNRPMLLLFYQIVNLLLVFMALAFSDKTYIKKDTLVIFFILFFVISNLNAWLKHIEQKKLKTSEEKFRLLVTQMQQGLAVHEIICDDFGSPIDYRFISVNEGYENITGLRGEDILGKTVLEVLPNTEKYWIEAYGKVALTGVPVEFDQYSVELHKYFSVSAYSPRKNQFAVIMSDISDKKKTEEKIEYLSYNDQLTGLHNRRYYEQQIERLNDEKYYPLTLIMADVNGLKLTNDAFGHKAGDALLEKTAKILKRECREDDIVVRLGGDEFILLLPETDAKNANVIIERINKSMANEKLDNIILSVSVGFAVKNDDFSDMSSIYKQAEDEMYRHKLSESGLMKSKTIDLILSTLFENNREMLHCKRVSALCEAIANEMNFSAEEIQQLKTAGLMHDIGKIAIDQAVLEKPHKLSKNEWNEVERHSEIGYRILSSSNEFSKIAEYVLEHHEKWNGEGYPKRIKGDKISIGGRIIAIADAYDAMRSDRVYKKGIDLEEAIAEIKKYSGEQFDPTIAKIFVEKVLDEAW